MNSNLYVIEYAVLVKMPQRNNSESTENGEKDIPRTVHNLGLQLRVIWRKKTELEIHHFI